MSNLLHILLSELSAILVLGGHLENGGISSGQGSEFNVCHENFILVSSTEVFPQNHPLSRSTMKKLLTCMSFSSIVYITSTRGQMEVNTTIHVLIQHSSFFLY